MWSEKKPSKKVNSTMFNIIQFVKNIETDHSCNVVGCNDSLIQMYLMTHWPHLPKLSRVIIVKKKRMLLSCFELNLETSPYSFDKTACEFRRYNSLLSITSDMSLLKDLRNQNLATEKIKTSLSLIKSDLFTGSPCNVNA